MGHLDANLSEKGCLRHFFRAFYTWSRALGVAYLPIVPATDLQPWPFTAVGSYNKNNDTIESVYLVALFPIPLG